MRNFHGINITNEIAGQLRDRQGVSSSGIQLAYEIPLEQFTKNRPSKSNARKSF